MLNIGNDPKLKTFVGDDPLLLFEPAAMTDGLVLHEMFFPTWHRGDFHCAGAADCHYRASQGRTKSLNRLAKSVMK